MKAGYLLRPFFQRTLPLFLLLFSFLFLTGISQASTAGTWTNTALEPLVFNGETVTDTAYDQRLRKSYSVLADLECQEATYQWTEEASLSSCWYETEFGELSRLGYAVRPNSRQAAAIEGYASEYFPTKNKNVFIETALNIDDGLDSLRFWRVQDMNFNEVRPYGIDGPLYYQLPVDKAYIVRNPGGSLYTFDNNLLYSNIWYSNNAEWMAIRYDDGYIDLFDLNDFSFRRIETAYPGFASLAISDNGRYIAVAVYGETPFVFDTQVCNTNGASRENSEVCSTRFLGGELQSAGANGGRATLPRFYDENTLGIYGGSYDKPSEYWEYIIHAPGTTGTKYLAMGDSFASGEGAGGYYPSTDVRTVNYCHLSKKSYPFLLASSVDFGENNINSVACSGARIKNIIGPELIDESLKNPDRSNQYRSVFATMGVWAPGYENQLKKIQDDTSIVSISIGGNDIGFKDIITNCAGSGTCYKSADERRSLVKLINKQFDRLAETYSDIKSGLRPGSKIYVIGYPEIVKPYGDCGLNVRMNGEETLFAEKLTRYLNSIIALASKRAGVEYVDVSNAFYGSRLCEYTNPSVHGVNLAMTWPPFSPESFHPTEGGQWLMHRAILNETQNFSKSMPRADLSIVSPRNNNLAIETGLLSLDESHYDTSGVIDFAYPPNQQIAMKGDVYTGVISSASYGLKRNAMYELWMTSDPVFLGEFLSNHDGQVEYTVTIPEDTESGWHTFRLRGEIDSGEIIEVRQSVYVVSPTDIPGFMSSSESLNVASSLRTYKQDSKKDLIEESIHDFSNEVVSGEPNGQNESQKTEERSLTWRRVVMLTTVIVLTVILLLYKRRRYA